MEGLTATALVNSDYDKGLQVVGKEKLKSDYTRRRGGDGKFGGVIK